MTGGRELSTFVKTTNTYIFVGKQRNRSAETVDISTVLKVIVIPVIPDIPPEAVTERYRIAINIPHYWKMNFHHIYNTCLLSSLFPPALPLLRRNLSQFDISPTLELTAPAGAKASMLL